MAARNARARALLAGPAFPAALDYLWRWFIDLRAAGKADEPVGYGEIHAWRALTGARPTPWEVAALRALDNAWLAPPESLEAALGDDA